MRHPGLRYADKALGRRARRRFPINLANENLLLALLLLGFVGFLAWRVSQ